MQDRVISVRTQPTIPEDKPAYDPQANGGAVRAVQEVRKTLEGNQIGVRGQNWRGDHGYHGHLGVDDPAGCGYDKQVLVWARWTHSLLKSTTHKKFHGEVYEFGEQVLAKPKGATNRSKRKQLWSQDFTMPRGWDTMTGARGHRCFEGRRSSNQGQEAKSRGRSMERDCNQGHLGDARHAKPEG